MNSFGWQTVVATPPMVHHGFMTVCPPVTVELASKAQSLKPRIIKGTTTSRSFSVILVETAKSISMLSHSVTPMAQRSLKTLAQAIFPEKKLQFFSTKKNYPDLYSFTKVVIKIIRSKPSHKNSIDRNMPFSIFKLSKILQHQSKNVVLEVIL